MTRNSSRLHKEKQKFSQWCIVKLKQVTQLTVLRVVRCIRVLFEPHSSATKRTIFPYYKPTKGLGIFSRVLQSQMLLPGMASSTGFTDDILIEIFAHLPLNWIYKFRCLSKVWLSNLSSPNFITQWFRINNKSLPWIQYHTIVDKGDSISLYSKFMSRNDYGFSFKFLRNEKPFRGARLYLLGSSNGLVLCYSFSRYHVCNPLTMTWVTLPSPLRFQPRPTDVSRIFCEYSSSSASRYKVVNIAEFHDPSKKFVVNVFCSDLGVWESFQVSCDENVVWYGANFDKADIRDGVLFWIEGGNRMLVYNLNQNNGSDEHRCNLINFPDIEFDDNEFGIFDRCIGESEGCVCYAQTRSTEMGVTVSVWVLNEVSCWQVLHKKISIEDILLSQKSYELSKVQVLGFSPVDRNVVFLGCKHRVWRFNMQTKSLEELCLDNRHVHGTGDMFLPFVLKPMPTVLPLPAWIDTSK